MSQIFARSPYIIEVNESAQLGSKLELFIYYNGASVPSTPTYTITKKIPSSTNLATYYDISPYIREYLKFTTRQTLIGTLPTTSGITENNNNQTVLIQVKRYKEDTTPAFVLLDTTTYLAFDGYGYYSEGTNPTNANFIIGSTRYASLAEGNYNYKYSALSNPTNNQEDRAGIIGIKASTAVDSIRYTDLSTGGTTQFNTPFSAGTATAIFDVPTVWVGYYANGNKLELVQNIGSPSASVKGTWYFRPVCEPRYTPVMIDFVNKFGYWQREFFYKASTNKISVQKDDYNLLQSDINPYNTIEGQKKQFNANGTETITVNTGYVKETFNETIQQIMLSEKILIDSLPAKLNTNSVDKIKGVNKKLISYTLNFEFLYSTINNVI